MRPGDTYKSFLITKSLPLDELQSTLIEAVHEPTGAKIMHIANDDPENVFCLSFQTLPSSSNGVPHILEHIVLCGSKKFPIKDPFFSMTRRSLNTYMNALTGQDFTCYPASSQVEKDFYNLLEVYLDAVFHPELKKMSFLQEGHRLEASPLQFQGVVYNEMKGALSSPESRLWEALLKHLTPDLPYAVNSGGNPKEIPNLTYEELKEFHKTFYHPSRCIFFSYGNLPLSKHLDFFEEKTLSGFQKEAPLPPLPLQKRFSAPVTAHASFPIHASEALEKKTWIVFSFLTAQLTHQEEILALCLLDSLLMDTDASVLKKALLKSGFCSQAGSSIDIEMSEAPMTIVCKGCEKEDAEKLKKVLFDTLKTCTFTEEQIRASLHQLEFDRKEIGSGGTPFGLELFFRAGLIKQHGSEPENALLIHTLFQDLRERLKNPEFLSNLLAKYLIDNPHYVMLTFSPDPNLEANEQKEEEQRLENLSASINKDALIEQSEKLTSYQESVETQNLECLPKLSLKDIPPKAKDFSLLETKIGDTQVFYHECFTNKILYADLVFDLPHVPQEDLPLVSLYARFMTELGCSTRDYQQNLAYQHAYTGDLSAACSLHISAKDPTICHPTFSIRGKALARNSEKFLSILADFAHGAHCDDKARVKELFMQHMTSLENGLVRNALRYAIQSSLKDKSLTSFISDEWYGLSYYEFVLRFKENPEMLADELIRIQEMILGRGNSHLVISCEKELFDCIKPLKLPKHPINAWAGDYSLPKEKAFAYLIPAPVAFTARGQNTVSYQDPRSASLLLSTELLENCHLHREIREKGGAYGGGASYSPQTGNFHFYAYRDPQLARTVGEFQKALEKIASGQFSEQELEEAKFGAIQSLDAPVSPGSRAIVAYSWKRSGRTIQDRQAFREKILNTTKKDVANAVKELLLEAPSTIVSFLGESLFEKENPKLKKPLLKETLINSFASSSTKIHRKS